MNTKIMKNALSILVIIAGMAAACSKNDSDSDAMRGGIVCLGNSLTAGYGASQQGKDDPAKSYPAYLQDSLNIPVINAGVSGNKTADGIARLQSDVIAHQPRIVIVELGANDLIGELQTLVLNPSGYAAVIDGVVNSTKRNLQTIISALRGGDRKIYVAKFYTEQVLDSLVAQNPLATAAMTAYVLQKYDAMYVQLFEANADISIIEDIWSGAWGAHMSDIIHPNADGYKIMAANIFSAIKPYLQANDWLKRH